MKIEPFMAEDFRRVDLQPGQAFESRWMTEELGRVLENHQAYTVFDGGEVLGCGGIAPLSPSTGLLWAYVSRHAGRRMVQIHKFTKRLVEASPYRRVEVHVACEFEQGHRWAKLLGFEVEAPRMRAARLDGGDVTLYARIK